MSRQDLETGDGYAAALQLPEKWARVVCDAFNAGAVAMLGRRAPAPRAPRRPRPPGSEAFMRRLATEGGTVVCTSALSAEQVAAAREAGRLFVLPDGTGFAHIPAPSTAE